MLKFVDFKVTFQEVPDEISLCINLSGCPHKCEGCHSSYLQEDIGTVLTTQLLDKMIESNSGITCVCFLGGDNDIPSLCTLAEHIKNNHRLKVAWYTGLNWIPSSIDRPTYITFDFVKSGPYIKSLGPLTSNTTNQRFYAKEGLVFHDITYKFWTNNNEN